MNELEAWLVDTHAYTWVFPYEADADDKMHDLEMDGIECRKMRLVPEAEVEKLRAANDDLKARIRARRRPLST